MDVIVAPGEARDLGDLKVQPAQEDRGVTLEPSIEPTTASGTAWARYEPTAEAPWDLRRVVHLHRRAGFAATWAEIQRDLNDGPEASINRVLTGTSRTGVFDEFESTANLLADAAVASGDVNRLRAWWIFRMLASPDPLAERLTLMWHDHFATAQSKVEDLGLMRRQNDTFRRLARAPFGELLNASVREPALLALPRRAGQPQGAPQRKPRPRADGAVHARHRQLHRSRRQGSRPRTDRLDGRRRRVSRGLSPNTTTARKPCSAAKVAGPHRTFCRSCSIGPRPRVGSPGESVGLLMGEATVDEAMTTVLADELKASGLDIGHAVETVLRSRAFFAARRTLAPGSWARSSS